MSDAPKSDKLPPKGAWLALFGFLILLQYIGGVGALVSALTLGFGMNNNGTVITDVGNLSINTSVIQTRLVNCSSGLAANGFDENGSTSCFNASIGGGVGLSMASFQLPASNITPGTNGTFGNGYYTFPLDLNITQSINTFGETNTFGTPLSGSRVRLRSNYTSSPANPPVGSADIIIVDNGITAVMRIRYNSPILGMKVGDVALV